MKTLPYGVIMRQKVLFVCIHNSCRSQMAEAFARALANDVIEPFSAGSLPSGRVDPKATAAMQELGYDMSAHHSKSLEQFLHTRFEYVITMGCGDSCPFIPAVHHVDWDLPDPSGLPMDEFRQVRDLIRDRVKELAEEIRGKNE